jgi:hypothetical protein
MQSDSFGDFLTQGPILRLVITTCFFGVLWLMMVFFVNQRNNERRRRQREGLPPLPNIFKQLMTIIQNLSQQPGQQAQHTTNMPLPDLNMLTSDLPEPDFDNFVPLAQQNPPAAAIPLAIPKPASTFATPDTHEGEFEEIKMSNQENNFVGDEPRRSTGSFYVAGSGEIPSDAVEVMRVWRDVSDGSLIIQMNGKVFQTVNEMQDRGLARRFISLVRDLAQLARVGAQAIGMPAPNFDSTSSVVSEQGSWASPKTPNKLPVPSSRPNTDYSNLEPPLIVTGLEPAPPSTSTIAGQIEELLQYRLTQNPMFQQRSIHVRANTDNTIRIEADGRTYQHVDDVVDVDVREFIQSVIREWEARQ